MANQRRLIHFSGDVQGVGFRFAARQAARAFAVTGYVRNLSDSRVEVLAEGPADEIDAFVEELRARMAGYVREVTQQTQSPTGEFDTFDIRL